jgi:hypothetical protein
VFFELTQQDKVARVAALGCEAFIDDLPEILAMPGFPDGMCRILFDPENRAPFIMGGHYRGFGP